MLCGNLGRGFLLLVVLSCLEFGLKNVESAATSSGVDEDTLNLNLTSNSESASESDSIFKPISNSNPDIQVEAQAGADTVADTVTDTDKDAALVSTMGSQVVTLFRFTNEGRSILENNSSSPADLQRLVGKGRESVRQWTQVGSGGPGGNLPNIIASPSTGSCGNPGGSGFCPVPSCGNASPQQCRRFCVNFSGYDDYRCTPDCYCGCITYTYFCNNNG